MVGGGGIQHSDQEASFLVGNPYQVGAKAIVGVPIRAIWGSDISGGSVDLPWGRRDHFRGPHGLIEEGASDATTPTPLDPPVSPLTVLYDYMCLLSTQPFAV